MLKHEHATWRVPQIGGHPGADVTLGWRDAAIDQPQRTRYTARLMRREEREDVGDLLRSSSAAERNHGVDCLLRLRVDRTVGATGPGGIDGTGADTIGATPYGACSKATPFMKA